MKMQKFMENLTVFALLILVVGNGVLFAFPSSSVQRSRNEDQLTATSLSQRLCVLQRCRHVLFDQLQDCIKHRCGSNHLPKQPTGQPTNLEPQLTSNLVDEEEPASEVQRGRGDTSVNIEERPCEGCEDVVSDCVGDNCSRTSDEAAKMLSSRSSTAKISPPRITATLSCREACSIITTDMDVEACVESYCTSTIDNNGGWLQSDLQSRQPVEVGRGRPVKVGGSKRWGNRIGRAKSAAKRWGNRICVEAHCSSFKGNAFVACGQSRCGK